MYESKIHRIADRIVSLNQWWVRPIVRGKQKAETEFGAKVEMSDIDGYLRIEEIRWDAFNESTTLIDSVEKYRKAYGHYPERVLADKIFRTRDNLRYCKLHGIHLNGPKLGKPTQDPAQRRAELKQEWLESGERGAIERRFGIGKRCYSLGLIMLLPRSDHGEAEGNQRNDHSSQRFGVEPAKEAQASFGLFQGMAVFSVLADPFCQFSCLSRRH